MVIMNEPLLVPLAGLVVSHTRLLLTVHAVLDVTVTDTSLRAAPVFHVLWFNESVVAA
jgi:hypothetical protein